jgi:O-antigen/teichoic acid export membrane protein
LGAERYGLWMIITSIIAVMNFADLGIGNGLLTAVAEADGRDDCKLTCEYVSSAFFVLILIAAALSLFGWIAYPLIPWRRVFNVSSPAVAAEGAKALAVLFAWFVINIPLGVVNRIQTGLQRGYNSQLFSAGGSLASLAGVLWAIHAKAGLSLLVFSSTAGSIFAILVNGALLFRAQPWLLPRLALAKRRSASRLFKRGSLFFVLQTAGAIGYNTDNIVIAHVLGAGAVAAYALPQKLFGYAAMVVMFSLGPLWPAYGEAISRGDIGWAEKTLRRSFYLSIGISACLNVVLVVSAPLLLRRWAGPSFTTPVVLVILLGTWGVIAALSSAVSMFLNAAGGKALRFQAGMAILMAATNIPLSIILTRKIGIAGVVAGSIISQIMTIIPTLLMVPSFIRHIRAHGQTVDPSNSLSARSNVVLDS